MIKFKGIDFDKVDRFDGRVLSFSGYNNNKNKSITQVLPISSKKYRDHEFTNDYAKIFITKDAIYAKFEIFCDENAKYEVLFTLDDLPTIRKACCDVFDNTKYGFDITISDEMKKLL